MIFAVSLIAAILGRPAPLVQKVYLSFGYDPILAVAVVEGESQFKPNALRIECDKEGRKIGTSYGLFQLFDKFHPQYRDDLDAHIRYGATFLLLKIIETGGRRKAALIAYNGGEKYPDRVLAIYEKIRVAILLDRRYGGRR